MSSARRFEGRVALVTGASRGLGRAIALRLATEGAHVHVGYRLSDDAAREVVEACAAAGGSAETRQLDVRDEASVRAALSSLTELDLLVNNAGVTRDQAFVMSTGEADEQVLAVNLLGAMRCSRAAMRSLTAAARAPRAPGGVSIVHVGSIAGGHGSPGQASYAASKAGLLGFARTLAREVAAQGIRVNVVVPGLFDAGMAQGLDHRVRTQKLATIPLERMGSAHELAAAVAFLGSTDASYITGQSLVVDGGLTT